MRWSFEDWFKYIISPVITILGSGGFVHWLLQREKLRGREELRLSVANNVRAFGKSEPTGDGQTKTTSCYRINPYWIYMDAKGKPRVYRHPNLVLHEWMVEDNCVGPLDWMSFSTVRRAAENHKWLEFRPNSEWREWELFGWMPMSVEDEYLFRPLPRRTQFEDGVKERL